MVEGTSRWQDEVAFVRQIDSDPYSRSTPIPDRPLFPADPYSPTFDFRTGLGMRADDTLAKGELARLGVTP